MEMGNGRDIFQRINHILEWLGKNLFLQSLGESLCIFRDWNFLKVLFVCNSTYLAYYKKKTKPNQTVYLTH